MARPQARNLLVQSTAPQGSSNRCEACQALRDQRITLKAVPVQEQPRRTLLSQPLKEEDRKKSATHRELMVFRNFYTGYTLTLGSS